MKRMIAIPFALAALWAGWSAIASAEDESRTYEIEMYNAFGIVEQSEVRVSGVNVGEVQSLDVNEEKRAVVTVEVSGDLAVFGDETTCSSEPQSLIAEYFIDCLPAGQPLEDGGTIPASQVSQTVQPDLVQNTMREPFKQRFRLLINEFGTGLAGNSEALNEAIRLGAPALTDLKEVTETLRRQRATIRQLNEDSSQTIGELAKRRDEIAAFVDEAEDTAAISAARRDDVSTNFSLLDDFLGELRPSLVQLDRLARAQTPLLNNLRGAAPHLAKLSGNLPAFNRNSEDALRTLGNAGDVGRRALRNGRDEIELLAEAGRKATPTLEPLGDFLSDLDDPRRAVEIDERAGTDTGRSGLEPGQRDTMGYTGLEGLLNYVRNQTLAINQFDSVSHLFRFGIYEANTGLCGSFNSGRNPDTGALGVPAQAGGVTTDLLQAADCVAWLGANQGGLTPGHLDEDLGLPQYDPSACPNGTLPVDAEQRYCDGVVRRGAERRLDNKDERDPNGKGPEGKTSSKPPSISRPGRDELPGLDLPGLGDVSVSPPNAGDLGGRDAQNATADLLDFLFTP
ncbi:MAG: phospholipid/cholesterol/gamma-HCH transport system substrate-binding protein [Solirubrobacterales bacterium]|jgi:virulence factor Mce-like protein|nr:phospholipid/cholesterol/gamma-HCH transport system substrate-binding protein [Solirubrobacterales bacterium]